MYCDECKDQAHSEKGNLVTKIDFLKALLRRARNEIMDKIPVDGGRDAVLYDTINAAIGELATDKPPRDTCENFKKDGSGEVTGRFCSTFEANSQVHAPTCQFAKKTVGPSDVDPMERTMPVTTNPRLTEKKCEHCGQIPGFPHSPGCKNEPNSAKFR